MSKFARVIVTVTCDECQVQDENTEEFSVLNSKGKPVLLDLHPKCHAAVYGRGLELADDRGVKPEKATPQVKEPYRPPSEGAERVCLVCPENRTSNSGILNHMTDKHDFPHSVPAIYGQKCPIDGQDQEGLLSRHIGQVHKQFSHISQAFDWAKKNGDEHGVVAARIAALKVQAEQQPQARPKAS